MDTFFFGGGEEIMFSIFISIFVIFFLSFLGIVIYTITSSIKKERKNDQSPILTVEATVVTKRNEVKHYHGGEDSMSSSHTYYFVTFQVASGDRLEFEVSGEEFGMLVEQDFGKLTFQGSRYLGFERQR